MIQVDSFKPFDERILVKPLPKKDKTDGGIIIADTVAIDAEMGIVAEIGDKVNLCQKGDTILYPTGTGWEIEVNKVKYKVIRQPQVEGIVS